MSRDKELPICGKGSQFLHAMHFLTHWVGLIDTKIGLSILYTGLGQHLTSEIPWHFYKKYVFSPDNFEEYPTIFTDKYKNMTRISLTNSPTLYFSPTLLHKIKNTQK